MRMPLAGLFFIPILVPSAACQLRPITQNGPVPGTTLTVTDSLMIAGTKMFHTKLIFYSPSIAGLAIDPRLQRDQDERGDRTQPRLSWALRYKDTPDVLEIVIHPPNEAGDAEQLMRDVAASERAQAAKAKRAVQEDSVDWNDHRREFRLSAREGKDVWLIRCVPYMMKTYAGFVTCFEAHGPTVETTLLKAVIGLTTPGYTEFMTGRPVVAGREPPKPSVVMAGNPSPTKPTEIGIANGKAFNAFVGFVVSVSPSTMINVKAQGIIDTMTANAGTFGWALVDTATQDFANLSVMPDGQWQIGEREWAGHLQAGISGGMRPYPGSRLLASRNDWRADTASYRFTFVDPLGVYHKSFCKGSSIGREKPVVVCVHTLSKRQDALDDVGNSLVLTRPGSDPLAQIKEQQ